MPVRNVSTNLIRVVSSKVRDGSVRHGELKGSYYDGF